ncbi:hypothetical protein CDL15_Pgr012655 [Punica granatum]|uniref:Uncharacterized protein n=1 Tax=Punica granatum TaxID=22663 RepID=A0A218WRM6_PUNGR|nr:hypothetical protein CDL15_Pgr012655 [Punica granatum]
MVTNASRRVFGAHSWKTEITAIPEHLETFGKHRESLDHKSLGLLLLMVFGQGRRANDPARDKELTETGTTMHKRAIGERGWSIPL